VTASRPAPASLFHHCAKPVLQWQVRAQQLLNFRKARHVLGQHAPVNMLHITHPANLYFPSGVRYRQINNE
jgi:hypothetical protein